MGVHFVYRSHYQGPAGKFVRSLGADTVLGWFRDVWDEAKRVPDVREWTKARLGCDVYGFASLFEAAQEQDLEPPKTDQALRDHLSKHLYAEGDILYCPHALQVLTDDDEIELAYYVFDDHYLEEHPGRAAYLLHDDWRLPTTSGESSFEPTIPTKRIGPPGSGAGATYLAFLAFYDSGSLTDLDTEGPRRIDGVRVPDLGDYLRRAQPDDEWPRELILLRSQLPPESQSGDEFAVALAAAGRLPERVVDCATEGQDPSKSLVATSDHLVQLSLHIGNWFGDDVYQQWVVFDDRWAGANRDLAEGILRYAHHWDVLTED